MPKPEHAKGRDKGRGKQSGDQSLRLDGGNYSLEGGNMLISLSITSSPAPAFSSAATNAAGTEIAVTVSGGPIAGTWSTAGFTVKTNGQRISLASASEINDVITLVVDSAGPIIDTETVTVSYDGTGNWANGGNALSPFTDQPVTNNSTVSPGTTFSGTYAADLDYSFTSGVDHVVDAYAATFQSSYPDVQYPVTFRDRGGAKTTVIGLTSQGHHDLTTDWNTTYNVWSPRDNTANIMAKDTGGLTIFRNCHISDVGWDCFRITSEPAGTAGVDTFIIEGAYVESSRDDFIECDDNCEGTIRDCLFDAGFAGISFTDDRNSPTGKHITMEGVLQRLTPYLYNGVETHFGPCVKLSSTSMTWSAENCIFAIEKPDHRTDYLALNWSKLTTSTNNFLLNLSDTPLAGGYALPPAGWTVLQGQAARDKWEEAKQAWLVAHGYAAAPSTDLRPAIDVTPTGANTASFSIAEVGPQNGEKVPGAGFWFSASNFTNFGVTEVLSPPQDDDPTMHEIQYVWDFDIPGTPFTSPVQLPSVWNDQNYTTGKHVYHAWDTPGTYTVTCLAININTGVWARATRSVTIQSLQTAYPGTRTILVDPANVGDNTTYPSSQVVTTLDAGLSALESLTQTGCLLLKRGETFTRSSQYNFNSSFNNVYIGAWGSGAKPIVKRTPISGSSAGAHNVFGYSNANGIDTSIFMDLRFEGNWDASKELGWPECGPVLMATHNAGPWSADFYRCEFVDFSSLFQPFNGGSFDSRSGLFDCHRDGWRDYGIYLGGSTTSMNFDKRYAERGCAVHQKANACRGGRGKIHDMGNDHGPFRNAYCKTVIQQQNSYFSNNSWPTGIQPCMRHAQQNELASGGYIIVGSMNALLTGFVGIDGQNDSAVSAPGNHVFENFFSIDAGGQSNHIQTGFGGTTYRNFIVVRRDQDGGDGSIIDLRQDNPTAANETARLDIHDGIVANLRSTATYTALEETGGTATATFTNKRIERINYHEPNLGTPNVPHAPLDTSTTYAEITLYPANKRIGESRPVHAISNVTSGSSVTVPYPAAVKLEYNAAGSEVCKAVVQADVINGGSHMVGIGAGTGNADAYYFESKGEITVTANAGDITITNNSGVTWNGYLRLGLDLVDTFYDYESYNVVTTTIPIFRQQAGSNLINGGGGGNLNPTPFDFLLNYRDATPDSGPYEGTS